MPPSFAVTELPAALDAAKRERPDRSVLYIEFEDDVPFGELVGNRPAEDVVKAQTT